MNEQKILSFIDLVRSSVPNAVEVFTQGNCGSFARMLLYAFPEGKIYEYLKDHFVFEHGGLLYDITGEVTGKYPMENLIDINDYADINELICNLTPRYKK